MVTVFLRGGLGNQMFQYAAGLSLARKREESLFLDTVFLNDRFPRKNFTYRTYDLDIFSLEPRFNSLSRTSKKFPIPGFWLGIDLAVLKLKELVGAISILKEEKDVTVNKDLALWGFWQSEKYFKDTESDIRAAFTFRGSLEGGAVALAEDIKKSESVSIHVRRGDYLLPKYQKLYGGTDIAYYERAIAYIEDKIDKPRFVVFSDDIAWCKGNIKLPPSTIYADAASSGPKASYHLQLMSLCKNNIIANSSFSWWGAWLNKNPKKIVIAPKHWYANASFKNNDAVPERWIKL